jgi:hypothetical protein
VTPFGSSQMKMQSSQKQNAINSFQSIDRFEIVFANAEQNKTGSDTIQNQESFIVRQVGFGEHPEQYRAQIKKNR